eukprot:1161311-Pelagomonas_calceolata.AAC.16
MPNHLDVKGNVQATPKSQSQLFIIVELLSNMPLSNLPVLLAQVHIAPVPTIIVDAVPSLLQRRANLDE